MGLLNLKNSKYLNSFLTKCWGGIKPTDPSVFCKICGAQKQEFLNPKTETIVVVECECEREYKMYKEWYENFLECKTNDGVKYLQLISGSVTPKTIKEQDIFKCGIDAREYLRLVEEKIKS